MFVTTQQPDASINVTSDIIPSRPNVFSSVAGETNQNLTAAQKELLIWHWKLGHIGFQWLRGMIASPQQQAPLDQNELKKPVFIQAKHVGTKTCTSPMCAACSLVRITKRSPDIRPASTPIPNSRMTLKTGDLMPGDCHSTSTNRQYAGASQIPKGRKRKWKSIGEEPSLSIMRVIKYTSTIKCPSAQVKHWSESVYGRMTSNNSVLESSDTIRITVSSVAKNS